MCSSDLARATVRIVRTADALVVEVSDDGPGVSRLQEGNGIRGMRERAASLGGTVTLGPGERGGFVLRADLPLVDLSRAVAT